MGKPREYPYVQPLAAGASPHSRLEIRSDSKRHNFRNRGVWIDSVLLIYSGLLRPRLYGTFRMKKFILPVSCQASRDWKGFKTDEGLHVSTYVRREKQAKATQETFRREYKARSLQMYLQNRRSIKLVIVTLLVHITFLVRRLDVYNKDMRLDW